MKKILVVDDELDVRRILNKRLTASGFLVVEAADGAAGVVVAKKEKPDLIILDVMMPVQDGLETYQILKRDTLTQRIPIIFLTGLSPDTRRFGSGLEGEGDYVVLGKPYDPKELLGHIHKALGEGEPLA